MRKRRVIILKKDVVFSMVPTTPVRPSTVYLFTQAKGDAVVLLGCNFQAVLYTFLALDCSSSLGCGNSAVHRRALSSQREETDNEGRYTTSVYVDREKYSTDRRSKADRKTDRQRDRNISTASSGYHRRGCLYEGAAIMGGTLSIST